MILFIKIIGGGRSTNGITIIPCVFPEDFQTTADIENTKQIRQAEDSIINIVGGWVLNVFDNEFTRDNELNALEVLPGSFKMRPSLDGIIKDCVAIMNITRPRIFVKSMDKLEACTFNINNPSVLLHVKIMDDCTDAELRFIIGREFGHIKCGHTRMMMLVAAVENNSSLTMKLIKPLFTVLLEACREAQLSADNAGLLCCQDLAAAEQVIIRTTCGFERRNVGELDVEAFLRQNMHNENTNKAPPLKDLFRSRHFATTRILSLREYAASERYQKVLERK